MIGKRQIVQQNPPVLAEEFVTPCLCEFQLPHHSTQAKHGGVLMVHTILNIQLLAREFNDASLTNALKSQFCFPIYVN